MVKTASDVAKLLQVRFLDAPDSVFVGQEFDVELEVKLADENKSQASDLLNAVRENPHWYANIDVACDNARINPDEWNPAHYIEECLMYSKHEDIFTGAYKCKAKLRAPDEPMVLNLKARLRTKRDYETPLLEDRRVGTKTVRVVEKPGS